LPGNKFPGTRSGLDRSSLSAAVLTSCDRQCNERQQTTQVRGVDHPRARTHVLVGGPRHLCGRGGRQLSLLTSAAWRTGHWSRTDGLTIASISCCCGSHIIHTNSEVITVNSDYTCCAVCWAFDAQFTGCGHKRRRASGSLDQRPLCNSGVKWSSLVSVHRSKQSCLL